MLSSFAAALLGVATVCDAAKSRRQFQEAPPILPRQYASSQTDTDWMSFINATHSNITAVQLDINTKDTTARNDTSP